MKKVIEVERGKPVPSEAKWIKDVQRVVGSYEHDDGHPLYGPETVSVYATFDVWEVPHNEPKDTL